MMVRIYLQIFVDDSYVIMLSFKDYSLIILEHHCQIRSAVNANISPVRVHSSLHLKDYPNLINQHVE